MGSGVATTGRSGNRLAEHLRKGLAGMHPAYFAMSMATGIVSIACHLSGLRELAALLFWINLAFYAALWTATIARAALFAPAFLADWSSHQRAPGFFTTVAATSVLGSQLVLLRQAHGPALALWILALVLWAACTYSVFVALSIRAEKPTLADGINGGWLVAVVATQSICILGCAVLPGAVADRDAALFFLVAFWLVGGMLYIWLISLIFYRYTFFRFAPTDLMPPYWINMGAVAISTLAGTALLGAGGDSALLASIRPFVKGFTLMWWATATWWIPMLLILGIWRHGVKRVPFGYEPLYWGLVFPFGMYAVATWRLVEAFELPFLAWLSRGFVVVAVSAWMLTFLGFTGRLVLTALVALRAVRRPLPAGAPSAAPLDHPSPGGSR